MKTRKYHIFAHEGEKVIHLQESSVRFSRANRAALKAKKEGKHNVFFAFADYTTNEPVGERHWPAPAWFLREKESEKEEQKRNRAQMLVDDEKVDFYRTRVSNKARRVAEGG